MFFFFFDNNLVKCQIKITFEGPKDGLRLKDFNAFMNSVNEFHEIIIKVVNSDNKINIESLKFKEKPIDVHSQLKIEHIQRINPYSLVVQFYENRELLMLVWSYWKLLMKICKRYGEDTEKIEENILNLKDIVRDFLEKFHEKYSKFLQFKLPELEPEYHLKIINDLTRLLNDKKFKRNYNLFCKSSIKITEIVSSFETVVNGTNDMLENIDFSEIIYKQNN